MLKNKKEQITAETKSIVYDTRIRAQTKPNYRQNKDT